MCKSMGVKASPTSKDVFFLPYLAVKAMGGEDMDEAGEQTLNPHPNVVRVHDGMDMTADPL